MAEPKFKRMTAEGRAALLVQAGLACLAEGGIAGFTVERICARAGASRGLIGHHFGSKDGLLAACYGAAYAPLLQVVVAQGRAPALPQLLDELLSDRQFRRDGLNIWLALWAEVAVNPALQAAHLAHYGAYQAAVAASIAEFAAHAGRKVDATALARALIALLDGLWVEMCVAPGQMDRHSARAAIGLLLAPHLGAIG